MSEHHSVPFVQSLATCLKKMATAGYPEDFQITENGLELPRKHSSYTPQQVQVVNYFHFEVPSNPDDNATVYVIETEDGNRGTLLEPHGHLSDPNVMKFMKAVAGLNGNHLKN